MKVAALVASTAALASSGGAWAQAYQCAPPASLRPAPPASRPADESVRALPVAGHILALSWSPEFCRTRKSSPAHAGQCSGRSGSFGFILHGLWPQGRGAWPQWCASKTRALSPTTVRGAFCAMPSPRLMAKQWAKHGSCMARRPESYFRASRILFDAMRYPDMDGLSRKPLTVGRFRQKFVGANEGLTEDMVRVKLNDRGWLREVRVCLGPSFRPRRCLDGRPLPATREMSIWRGA